MPPTARARVRAEITREIATAARSELAEVGAQALSLRSVSRRLGMAPSALYRYYDSRDHLLTALIVETYQALSVAATRADRAAGPDPWDRWTAVGRALRRWSARRPHEWALVFGSPVPGYEGTDATTAAALALHGVAIGIVADAHHAGRLARPGVELEAAAVMAPMTAVAPGVPLGVLAAGTAAWVQVLGHVSLERFGHLRNATADPAAWFDVSLGLAAGTFGLRPR